jgi:hypothetical protein
MNEKMDFLVEDEEIADEKNLLAPLDKEVSTLLSLLAGL